MILLKKLYACKNTQELCDFVNSCDSTIGKWGGRRLVHAGIEDSICFRDIYKQLKMCYASNEQNVYDSFADRTIEKLEDLKNSANSRLSKSSLVIRILTFFRSWLGYILSDGFNCSTIHNSINRKKPFQESLQNQSQMRVEKEYKQKIPMREATKENQLIYTKDGYIDITTTYSDMPNFYINGKEVDIDTYQEKIPADIRLKCLAYRYKSNFVTNEKKFPGLSNNNIRTDFSFPKEEKSEKNSKSEFSYEKWQELAGEITVTEEDWIYCKKNY